MSPFGSSWASDGYVVGVRTEKTSRPDALSRSTQPPISVTSVPPSGSGVAPFGEWNERGGSWTQLAGEPNERRILCVSVMRRTRQFWMSATWITPFVSRYASSGFDSSPAAEPATPARPYDQTIRFVRRSICASDVVELLVRDAR